MTEPSGRDPAQPDFSSLTDMELWKRANGFEPDRHEALTAHKHRMLDHRREYQSASEKYLVTRSWCPVCGLEGGGPEHWLEIGREAETVELLCPGCMKGQATYHLRRGSLAGAKHRRLSKMTLARMNGESRPRAASNGASDDSVGAAGWVLMIVAILAALSYCVYP